MDGDSNPLPADVTQVIFWALNLIMQEKEEILYLLDNERGVTIATMRDYIANCFKTYKMIASALGSAPKPRLPPPPPRLPPAHITAGSATTEEDKQSRGRGRGQGGGFRGKGRGGGGTGPPQPSAGRGKDGRVGRAAPSCEYCVAKKRPPNPHNLTQCPWVSAATHSELMQVLPKLCVGCLRIKSDGIHKCPSQLKEGGVTISAHNANAISNFVNLPPHIIVATYQKRLWAQR